MIKIQAIRANNFGRSCFLNSTLKRPKFQSLLFRRLPQIKPFNRNYQNNVVFATAQDLDDSVKYMLDNFAQLLELQGVQRTGALQDLVTYLDQLSPEEKDGNMPYIVNSGLYRKIFDLLKEDRYFLYVDGYHLHKLLFMLGSYGQPGATLHILEIIEEYERENKDEESLIDIALNQLQKNETQSIETLNALQYLLLFTYTPVGIRRLIESNSVPKLCQLYAKYLDDMMSSLQISDGVAAFLQEGDPQYEEMLSTYVISSSIVLQILRAFKYTLLGAYVMMSFTEIMNASAVSAMAKNFDKGIKEGLDDPQNDTPQNGLLNIGFFKKIGEVTQQTTTDLAAKSAGIQFGEVMGYIQECMYVTPEEAVEETSLVENTFMRFSWLYQDADGMLLSNVDPQRLHTFMVHDSRTGQFILEKNSAIVNGFLEAVRTVSSYSGLNSGQKLRVYEVVSKALLDKDASELEGNALANAVKRTFSNDDKESQSDLYLDNTQEQKQLGDGSADNAQNGTGSDAQNLQNARDGEDGNKDGRLQMNVNKNDEGRYHIDFSLAEEEEKAYEAMKDAINLTWIEKNAKNFPEQIQASVAARWVEVLRLSMSYSWTCCFMTIKMLQNIVMKDQINRINNLNQKFDKQYLVQVCKYLKTLRDIDNRNPVEMQQMLTYFTVICSQYKQSHSVIVEQDVRDWLFQPSKIKDTQNKLSVIMILNYLCNNQEVVEKLPMEKIVFELKTIVQQSVESWGINPLADGSLGIVFSLFVDMMESGTIYNDSAINGIKQSNLMEYLVQIIQSKQEDSSELCNICENLLTVLYAAIASYHQEEQTEEQVNQISDEIKNQTAWLANGRMSDMLCISNERGDSHFALFLGNVGHVLAPQVFEQGIITQVSQLFEIQMKKVIDLENSSQQDSQTNLTKERNVQKNLNKFFEASMRSDKSLLFECLKCTDVRDLAFEYIKLKNGDEKLKTSCSNVIRLFLIDQDGRIELRKNDLEKELYNSMEKFESLENVKSVLEALSMLWATEKFDAEKVNLEGVIDIQPSKSTQIEEEQQQQQQKLENQFNLTNNVKVNQAPSQKLKNRLKGILEKQNSRLPGGKQTKSKKAKIPPKTPKKENQENYDDMEGIDLSDPSIFGGDFIESEQISAISIKLTRKEKTDNNQQVKPLQNIDIQSMWISESDSYSKLDQMVQKMIGLFEGTTELIQDGIIGIMNYFSDNLNQVAPQIMIKNGVHQLVLKLMCDGKRRVEVKSECVMILRNITNMETKNEIMTNDTVRTFLEQVQIKTVDDDITTQFRYLQAQCLSDMCIETENQQLLISNGAVDIGIKLTQEKCRQPDVGTPTLIHACGLLICVACIPEDPDQCRPLFLRLFPHLKRVLTSDDISLQYILMAMLIQFVRHPDNRQDMQAANMFNACMKIVYKGSKNQNSNTFYESVGLVNLGMLAGHAAAVAYYLLEDENLKMEQILVDQLLVMCQHGESAARHGALALIGLFLSQIEDNPGMHYRVLQYGIVPTVVRLMMEKDEDSKSTMFRKSNSSNHLVQDQMAMDQMAQYVWQSVATDDEACAAIAQGGMVPLLTSTINVPGLELDQPKTPKFVQFD